MIDLIVRYWPALFEGLRVTLALTAIVWLSGLTVGCTVGVIAGSLDDISRLTVKAFSIVVGAIPLLVILFWFHYPVQSLLNLVVDPFYTTAFVLSVVNAVLVAEAVAETIHGLPSEWAASARVNGLSWRQTQYLILFPLALRQLVGPLLLIEVNMFQATIFGSLISVEELFRVVQRINSIEYDPVRTFSLLAVFFLLICAPIQLTATIWSRRFARDLSLR
jgi:ABC-type amino acid transport system permease subunit